jgi:acyl-CoA synthetase (AMP-forming)/AMP-acid ligase II
MVSVRFDVLMGDIRERDMAIVQTGASEPSTPSEGELFINTGSNVMKVYYNGIWETLHTFASSFLLMETGFDILLESSDKIIL